MALVTLTFDNGPEPAVTARVLDTLAAHGVSATFFVIGANLVRPGAIDVVRRAVAEGHRVGNHTFTHNVALGDTDDPDVFDSEVERTQDLLGELAPDRLFRPYCNSGVIDHRVLRRDHLDRLLAGGYTCVMFDAVVEDWCDESGWVDRALDAIGQRDHTVLVLHDIIGSQNGHPIDAMAHLDRFIASAIAAGHRFVQDAPPSATPILRGERIGPVDHFVS